jgi:outer membrane protein TolC
MPERSEVYTTAFENNPDYVMQIEKAARDGVAYKYARNQRLPELNLNGTYGLSGLGADPGDSWDEVSSSDWPSWSVGVEFRIPLGGGVRGRHEVEAARLREQQSLLGLRSMETQLLNSLDTAFHRIGETSLNVSNYQSQVELNQRVLAAALTRLDVGQIESRKVLEIEARLLETQSAEVESLANHRKSIVELHFLEGSLLERRNLDFTQKDLEAASESFIRRTGMNRDRYAQFIRTAQTMQTTGGSGPWPEEREEMRQMRSTVRSKADLLDRDEGFLDPAQFEPK